MSEDYGPGMKCHRRCACGAPLAIDDGERCAECKPVLSKQALVAAARRRKLDDEIAAMEIEAALLHMTIKRVNKWLSYYVIRQRSERSSSTSGSLSRSGKLVPPKRDYISDLPGLSLQRSRSKSRRRI
jgi:hypothetical protein